MSRSKWKSCFIVTNLYKKKASEDAVKIWSRSSVIPSSLLNNKVLVYTGKVFRSVLITEDKIGLKFGEFAFTRKRVNKYISPKKELKSKK